MIYWVVACAGIALLAFVAATFNELVAARNAVRARWADIDVQLQRRHDLVPQLSATVAAYADFERSTLSAIAEARSRALAATGVGQRGQVETQFAQQLARVVALGESYPALKASANFSKLQDELVDIEDRLQDARSAYNAAVQAFNTLIANFPQLLVARPFGFAAQDYFQAETRPVGKATAG